MFTRHRQHGQSRHTDCQQDTPSPRDISASRETRRRGFSLVRGRPAGDSEQVNSASQAVFELTMLGRRGASNWTRTWHGKQTPTSLLIELEFYAAHSSDHPWS